MPAWAVTIHKAQGKTLSRAVVDLGSGAFASGQVYVALSRVRALTDLTLVRPIREDEVLCDPLVIAFHEHLIAMTQL
jgi:ATP-dependent exoDNAse (exonuclease V) alpha subunit